MDFLFFDTLPSFWQSHLIRLVTTWTIMGWMMLFDSWGWVLKGDVVSALCCSNTCDHAWSHSVRPAWVCHAVWKRRQREATYMTLVNSPSVPAIEAQVPVLGVNKCWGIFSFFLSSQLGPQTLWSREKPPLLCPVQIPVPRNREHNKLRLLSC